MNVIISMWLFFASVWALNGTNAQARLSRQRLFGDEDPVVAAAGRLWTPTRWVAFPSRRRRRKEAEDAVRKEPERWHRYERLRQELRAWNAIESSVAIAMGATLLSIAVALVD